MPRVAVQRAVCEPVAQLVEHETFNLGVVGSSPTGLTKDFRFQMTGLAGGLGPSDMRRLAAWSRFAVARLASGHIAAMTLPPAERVSEAVFLYW